MASELITTRDQVWTQALRLACTQGRFKASEIEVTGARRTVRKVLNAMESLGWLSRTNPQSGIWRAGPKTVELMNITDEALENARTD